MSGLILRDTHNSCAANTFDIKVLEATKCIQNIEISPLYIHCKPGTTFSVKQACNVPLHSPNKSFKQGLHDEVWLSNNNQQCHMGPAKLKVNRASQHLYIDVNNIIKLNTESYYFIVHKILQRLDTYSSICNLNLKCLQFLTTIIHLCYSSVVVTQGFHYDFEYSRTC